MKSKILITGATGFIGSHLAKYLSSRGNDVTCLIRKTSNLRWLKDLNVQYHFGTVTDRESLVEAARGKDVIYHLAGLTKAISPRDYYRVNAEGTKNLLEVSAEKNPGLTRFILASSLAAAGPSPSDAPIDETRPPAPITDYGKSKLEAEKIAAGFMDRIPITVVRPPAVYGPRDHDIYLQFKMIQKGWIFSVGKKDQLVSIVYGPDLARAMVRLAECEKAVGETYFVSNPEPYRWNALSEGMKKALGKKKVRRVTLPVWLAEVVARCCEWGSFFTKKPALLNRQKMLEIRQPSWVCSPEKMERDTGFVCPTKIEQGLVETARWYRENGWL